MQIRISVDIAEPRPHRLIHKQQIRILMPAPRVLLQRVLILYPVRANFHQRPVHAATARSAVEPYHSPLSLRNVLVLEVPEEEVTVVVRVDGYVAASSVNHQRQSVWIGRGERLFEG